jgi:hypothetical protein
MMRKFAIVAVLVAGLGSMGASSHAAVPGDPSDMMGTIAGTQMSRDEFRARAYVQLTAVALNAHAFYAVEGDFPVSYYDLFNSDAWNLDVTNLFSGRTVNAIEFQPGPGDLTSSPPSPIPMGGESASPGEGAKPPDLKELTRAGGALEHGIQIDTDQLTAAAKAQGNSGATRVNPDAIGHHPAGDIFYYAKSGLLQLVMFAPDGTYTEFVSQVPNRYWLDILNIRSAGRSYPADLFANEVLFYLERLLPRHYNLVQFMGSEEPLSEPQLKKSGALERVKMARELSVSVLNPFNKKPANIAEAPQPGELKLDPASPVPLRIALRDGKLASFDELSAGPGSGRPEPGRQQPAPKQQKPKGPRKAPPLGGRSG